MSSRQIRNSILLFITATIWGSAFVAQRAGMDYIGPYTFNGIRSLIGGVVLLPFVFIFDSSKFDSSKSDKQKYDLPTDRRNDAKKTLLTGGVLCGIVLCVASSAQQIALQYTQAGKAGFITAFYIVLVPLLGLFFGKKCGKLVYISVGLALTGMFVLCIDFKSLRLEPIDLLLLFSAFVFSVHILVIDHFSPLVSGVKMSCIQFFVCGAICIVAALLFETIDIKSIMDAWVSILYAGVLSCGVAYTLQIVGQKDMNPTIASLIMSLESVMSLIAGWIILGERMSGKEMIGCVIMFAAIILSQLPQKSGVSQK